MHISELELFCSYVKFQKVRLSPHKQYCDGQLGSTGNNIIQIHSPHSPVVALYTENFNGHILPKIQFQNGVSVFLTEGAEESPGWENITVEFKHYKEPLEWVCWILNNSDKITRFGYPGRYTMLMVGTDANHTIVVFRKELEGTMERFLRLGHLTINSVGTNFLIIESPLHLKNEYTLCNDIVIQDKERISVVSQFVLPLIKARK